MEGAIECGPLYIFLWVMMWDNMVELRRAFKMIINVDMG